MLWTRPGKSLCARDQTSCARSPTNGKLATLAGGSGIWSVLSRTFFTRLWTESPNWLVSMTGRRNDDAKGEQDDQSGGQPLFTSDPGGQRLMQRIGS